MHWQTRLGLFLAIAGLTHSFALSQESGGVQQRGKFLAPPGQVIAIRAGRLFDAKSGNILNNQIVGMEKVDPTEASVRVNTLQTQIQTALALTSQLQKISLINYL